jgi:hypothetical protein
MSSLMPARRALPFCFAALLLAPACAPTGPVPTPSPDRVLLIDESGRAVRQSTFDENARVVFRAPLDRVWSALVAGYTDLGIEPSVVDRASGQYGNTRFIVPRRVMDRPIGDFFRCGSGLSGPLVDQGRVIANIVTTLAPMPDGTTSALTHVSGQLRRHDGASSEPIVCASTGALEDHIRQATEQRVAGMR